MLYSFFQNSRLYNKNRDAITLHFEIYNENMIRVTRQFFVFENYKKIITDFEYNKLKSIELREIVGFYTTDDLKPLICNLTKHIDSNTLKHASVDKLFSSFNNINSSPLDFINAFNNFFEAHYYSITEKRLKFDEQLLENLNSQYEDDFTSNINDLKIPLQMPDVTEKYGLYQYRIFNVGQANCSALIKFTDDKKQNYKVLIVFDFGCDSRHLKNKWLKEMVNKIDNETFILISHFHYDHFNLLDECITSKTIKWIFPTFEGKQMKSSIAFNTLKAVAKKKTFSNKIYITPDSFHLSHNVFVAQNSAYTRHTSINNKGLVSKISINSKNILVPGDCIYEYIDPKMILSGTQKYDYVLLPHHCCKYDLDSSKKPNISSFISEETYGIISCGHNNYGHANIKHANLYKNLLTFTGQNFYVDKHTITSFSGKTNKKRHYHKIDF